MSTNNKPKQRQSQNQTNMDKGAPPFLGTSAM